MQSKLFLCHSFSIHNCSNCIIVGYYNIFASTLIIQIWNEVSFKLSYIHIYIYLVHLAKIILVEIRIIRIHLISNYKRYQVTNSCRSVLTEAPWTWFVS